jgi:uracil-DNA glycosylase family 4
MIEPSPTAEQLLRFYIDAGVDAVLSETPIDRLAPIAEPEPVVAAAAVAAPLAEASRPSPTLQAPAAAAAPPAPDVAAMAAREAAGSARTLDELRELLTRFDGCALKATATQLVFSRGNPNARIMFVGEAPGRDEDIAGEPFVGRSGKLLDLMLASIGLDNTSVYIANIIPWRPPGNRTPTPQETQICLPFIRRQIELVNPDVLVCLGNPSSQGILGTKEGIMRTRGRWMDYDTGTRTIRAMATFHPAYLLRSPAYKRLAWQDFRAIRKALAG